MGTASVPENVICTLEYTGCEHLHVSDPHVCQQFNHVKVNIVLMFSCRIRCYGQHLYFPFLYCNSTLSYSCRNFYQPISNYHS